MRKGGAGEKKKKTNRTWRTSVTRASGEIEGQSATIHRADCDIKKKKKRGEILLLLNHLSCALDEAYAT